MKSAEEIQFMLVNELWDCLERIKAIDLDKEYYNDMLGDTSFLLAGLLGVHLKTRSDWDKRKWLDDCLITRIKLIKNRLSIWGIMIWGVENTTEQWTDPFYYEIELGLVKSSFISYYFLFGDLNQPELLYEEFRNNRTYWDQAERTWRHKIGPNPPN